MHAEIESMINNHPLAPLCNDSFRPNPDIVVTNENQMNNRAKWKMDQTIATIFENTVSIYHEYRPLKNEI